MTNLYIIYGLILGFLVYNLVSFWKSIRKLTERETLLYSFLLASLTGWIVSNCLSDLVGREDIAAFAARSAVLFPPSISLGLFYISNYFPQTIIINDKHRNAEERLGKFAVWFTLLFTFIALLSFNTDLNIRNFHIVKNDASYFEPGYFYLATIIYATILLILGFSNWRRKNQYYTNLQKQQIRILKTVLILFLVMISSGYTILPALNLTNLTPFTFTSIILFIYILQRNFVSKNTTINIKKVWRQLLIFATVVLVSVAYVYGVVNLYNDSAALLFYFVGTALLLIIAIKIYSFLRTKLDANNTEEIVLGFIKKSSKTLELNAIIELIYKTLHELFPESSVDVCINLKHRNDLTNVLNLWRDSGRSYIITPEILLDKYYKDTIHKTEIVKVYNLMRERNLEIILPIGKSTNLSGAILITNFNEALDQRFYKYLKLFVSNVSIAISRATLYEEVKNFAGSLQKKVDDATIKLRHQKEELQEKYQYEKDMMGIMGHELRTPMTVARGMAELMLNKLNSNVSDIAYYKDKTQKIHDSVMKESDLIQTMLSTSHVDNNKINLQITPVNIEDLIEYSISAFKKDADAKSLNLYYDKILQEVPTITTDMNRAQEIINNLVSNAVKYTNDGYVKVYLTLDGENIGFNVEDSGIGIPPEEITNIGKKFYRIHQHLDKYKDVVRAGGTGLGLYVVKGVLKALGGDLKVVSEVGKGSTFTAVFPVQFNNQDNVVLSDKPVDEHDMFEKLGFKEAAKS